MYFKSSVDKKLDKMVAAGAVHVNGKDQVCIVQELECASNFRNGVSSPSKFALCSSSSDWQLQQFELDWNVN